MRARACGRAAPAAMVMRRATARPPRHGGQRARAHGEPLHAHAQIEAGNGARCGIRSRCRRAAASRGDHSPRASHTLTKPILPVDRDYWMVTALASPHRRSPTHRNTNSRRAAPPGVRMYSSVPVLYFIFNTKLVLLYFNNAFIIYTYIK